MKKEIKYVVIGGERTNHNERIATWKLECETGNWYHPAYESITHIDDPVLNNLILEIMTENELGWKYQYALNDPETAKIHFSNYHAAIQRLHSGEFTSKEIGLALEVMD